jgi:hypothetical protein
VQRSGLPSRTALLLCTSFCHSNLEAVDRGPSLVIDEPRESRFRAGEPSYIPSTLDVRVPLTGWLSRQSLHCLSPEGKCSASAVWSRRRSPVCAITDLAPMKQRQRHTRREGDMTPLCRRPTAAAYHCSQVQQYGDRGTLSPSSEGCCVVGRLQTKSHVPFSQAGLALDLVGTVLPTGSAPTRSEDSTPLRPEAALGQEIRVLSVRPA